MKRVTPTMHERRATKRNMKQKKEGKEAIQTVIAQYGFARDFSSVRNQVGALITSINNIREEHPIVNDIYEKKSKK